MYSFKSSYLKPLQRSQPYQNVNLTNIPLQTILDSYSDGFITLTHTNLKKPVYLLLSKLRTMDVPVNPKLNFGPWLTQLGNRRLPTIDKAPKYVTEKVYCRDAVLAGFHVDPCEPYKTHKTDAAIGNKTNLYLQVSQKAIPVAHKRFLTTVNGMMHRCTGFEDGCHIVDGGVSAMHYGACNVGVWSFEHIGDIHQFALTNDNVFKLQPSIPLSKSFVIKLGRDIENTSIVLSLGGFPYVNPPFVSVVNAEYGIIKVDTSKIDIATCLLQSRHRLNLTDLGLFDPTDTDENESFGKLDTRDLANDVLVKKWLTLPQSFVAIIDTPDLTVQEHSAHWTGLYGVYEYHENPYHVLMDNYGRCPEYWVKKQHEAWIVLVEDPVYRPYITNTTNQDEVIFRNDAIPYHAETELPMTFLEITSTKKTKTA